MKRKLFSVGLFSRTHNGLTIAEYYFRANELPIAVIDISKGETSGLAMYHNEDTQHAVRTPGGYIKGYILTLDSNPKTFRSFFGAMDSYEKTRFGAEREERIFGTSNVNIKAETYVVYNQACFGEQWLMPGHLEFTDAIVTEAMRKMGVTLSSG